MDPKLIIQAFGIFLFVGAFFGWKAGSKTSLIMGIVSGALTFLGLYLIGQNPKNGYLYLLILSGVLDGVFVMRLLKTKKMMPSGMLLAVSLLFSIFCLMQFMKL